MPRVARIGQRLPFTLTVRNVGSVPARSVLLADVPPASVSLAQLRTNSRVRVRINGGNAFWRLGTLAPGASRTIRGSVLITSGSPGLHRNIVGAVAVNARLVTDRADARLIAQGVLGQRRGAPRVTG
jgi:uncharacterized repeat protein (TIGR01451 family)